MNYKQFGTILKDNNFNDMYICFNYLNIFVTQQSLSYNNNSKYSFSPLTKEIYRHRYL